MRRFSFYCFCFFLCRYTHAQSSGDTLTADLLSQYISYLASDSLKGRRNYSAELYTAARFIAEEFRKANLSVFPSTHSYVQPFTTKDIPPGKRKLDTLGHYDPALVLLNVVGILPGRSKANEAIIFSAHYDHVGMDTVSGGDNIFNGANDNASGTAALLSLARYYSLRNDNERTLIFCAFAGEELGLFGSATFTPYVNVDNVKAVVNLEMLGRSTVGKNAFFITGANYSNLRQIFVRNLKGSKVRVTTEPSFEKRLFMRSDNFPFAQKGIPAHTLMCSDDTDECYHKPCDEAKRIDVNNMVEIVKAIAVGCKTIISGADTPTRINPHRIY